MAENSGRIWGLYERTKIIYIESYIFRVINFSLDICVPIRGEDLCVRRIDNLREIYEAERTDRMRELRRQISPKISNYFSLFGCLIGGSKERIDPRRRSNIFQNL